MKFNAHLLQSQNNMGDIGSGLVSAPVVAGTGNWDAGDFTKSSDSDLSNPISTNDFTSDLYYKNGFINKLFSLKPRSDVGNNVFGYMQFFNGDSDLSPYTQPHEIPTMGQVVDYILKKPGTTNISQPQLTFRGGIIPRYLGDTIENDVMGDFIDLLMGGYVDDRWRYSYSFQDKVKEYFEILLGGSEYSSYLRFPNLFVDKVTANTFTGSVTQSANASSAVFSAGYDSDSNLAIFKVEAKSTGDYRRIMLNYDTTGKPVGITGQISSGSISSIGTGDWTFVDVNKYFLRSSANIRVFGESTTYHSWLDATSLGIPQFNYGNITSRIINGDGSSNSKIITNIIGEDPDIKLNTKFTFKNLSSGRPIELNNNLPTSASRRALQIYPVTASGWVMKFIQNYSGDEWNATYTIPIKSASGDYVLKDSVNFLISDGEQQINTNTLMEGSSTCYKALRLTNASGNHSAFLGVSTGKNFFASSYNNFIAELPEMNISGKFLVTNPLVTQIIGGTSKSLQVGDVTSNSVLIDGNTKSINIGNGKIVLTGSTDSVNASSNQLKKIVYPCGMFLSIRKSTAMSDAAGVLLQKSNWGSSLGPQEIYSDTYDNTSGDVVAKINMWGDGLVLSQASGGGLLVTLPEGLWSVQLSCCGFGPESLSCMKVQAGCGLGNSSGALISQEYASYQESNAVNLSPYNPLYPGWVHASTCSEIYSDGTMTFGFLVWARTFLWVPGVVPNYSLNPTSLFQSMRYTASIKRIGTF